MKDIDWIWIRFCHMPALHYVLHIKENMSKKREILKNEIERFLETRMSWCGQVLLGDD